MCYTLCIVNILVVFFFMNPSLFFLSFFFCHSMNKNLSIFYFLIPFNSILMYASSYHSFFDLHQIIIYFLTKKLHLQPKLKYDHVNPNKKLMKRARSKSFGVPQMVSTKRRKTTPLFNHSGSTSYILFKFVSFKIEIKHKLNK